MKLNPYLSFDGDCEAACIFYQQVLGGNIGEKMTWADCPEGNEIPSGWENKIMHMQMSMGDYQIMGADIHPDYFESSKGISLSINVEDPAQAERIFAALSENGSVRMPIQENFWATRFGMVTDQFGTPWMINCDKPD